ncbi:SDR family oxidoreductase [Scleromatobacter humisilvae]|uniref:SDR family oxidoreductase n=1 Tax=Scleromatobacter humisilvae TaxID=2897159 RepID=A0A9X1YGU9_9BURK|nr:SDR family oxidoreductase [Scleromatobacter humisilvae]MCK9685482.1 SDR family oxidoreductase [Scleromatobacter humisilvae]
MATAHHPDAEKTSRPVALVTGAARRIGRVIALELARAGFDIALHHRGASPRSFAEAMATADELRAAGARAEPFAADFADPSATAALLPAVAEAFGRVDAVVNSASRFEYDSPAAFDPALLESLTRSNVAAPVALAQALAAQAREQAPHARATPCVVNILDQKLHNPNPDYFSYTLTKAALAQATVLLAQALAPAVRVCGVSPGITLVSGPMDEDEFAKAHKLTALGRSSTPEDIARAVRFLIESPAITGVDLAVDGGQHLIGQARDVLFLARDDQNASKKTSA